MNFNFTRNILPPFEGVRIVIIGNDSYESLSVLLRYLSDFISCEICPEPVAQCDVVKTYASF